MEVLKKPLHVQLSVADAIVLAEFIRQLERKFESVDVNADALVSLAEKRALENLDRALEGQLTEPLVTDYNDTFQQAVNVLSAPH